jgi:flavin-dependent dehydrogenase
MTKEAHILVIGGGPAGLAAAIAARQRGFSVAVADACQPPVEKACGEGLLPAGVATLGTLGVHLSPQVAFPFRGIRFADEQSCASAAIPHGSGFGMPRTALQGLLMQRAAALGVELLWGTRVTLLGGQRVAVNGAAFDCKWVIGADGRNSGVATWARLAPRGAGRRRFGFRRHYCIAPWSDSVELYWGDRTQLVVTPTGVSSVCVVAFTEDPRLRLARALPKFPEVAAKLQGAAPMDSERGDQTSASRLQAVARGRVALVGDAAGPVDALTGYGLSLAFQEAVCLAAAFERDDLRHYASAHQRLMHTPARMSRLLVTMASSAPIRRRALRLFARRPELFAKILTVHTGPLPETFIGAGEILGLGWQVLRA